MMRFGFVSEYFPQTVQTRRFGPFFCFCARSPAQPFWGRQMLWRMTRDGRRSIDGDLLRVERNGVAEETRLYTETALRERRT